MPFELREFNILFITTAIITNQKDGLVNGQTLNLKICIKMRHESQNDTFIKFKIGASFLVYHLFMMIASVGTLVEVEHECQPRNKDHGKMTLHDVHEKLKVFRHAEEIGNISKT
jgi:hypothetical protein